jgi:dual-specificity kinase
MVTPKFDLTFFRYEFQKAHQFRPYPLSAVRDIIRQSIDALAYVHSLELVHTDIKPENICLVSGVARKPGAPANTKIRLIDFGTAEWCAKDGHRNALVSTRQYRAPEVVMGLGWNHVADLWAIGCVLIEMLAGRQIFPTVRQMQLSGYVRANCVSLSAGICALCSARRLRAARHGRARVRNDPAVYD